ncbi:MAG: glycosyltransferase family 4 protein, partial [Moorea sp. SIO4G2]|nr:glycosyltransferase family 4 protein [Moorena sp. SIO4G2]
CGRPIIASVPLNGTAARVVRQSGGGVVVPPQQSQALASAIVELYENPEQGVSLGQQGRKFALKHFAYQNALNSYEALLTQITKKPNHNSLIELQQFSD